MSKKVAPLALEKLTTNKCIVTNNALHTKRKNCNFNSNKIIKAFK